jgi:signal transduction histidine kinase
LIPLAFSLAIARTYTRPYFLNWTFSYLFYALSVALLSRTEFFGNSALWMVLLVVIYTAADWTLLRTAYTLREARPMPRAINVAAGLSITVSFALYLAGQPFILTALAPLLLGLVAHWVVAFELFRLPHWKAQRAHRWLGVLVALAGTWALAFPALQGIWLTVGYVFSGTLHLVVGVVMVIFLLEDAALTLRLQNEELKALDELKTNFISTVSHELRTPLSSIRSAVWLLRQHRGAVDPEEVIGIISSQSEALQHLVEDLLDFSKIESGSLTYRKEPVAVGPLVQAVVRDMRPMFTEKSVGLAVEDGPADLHVMADFKRVSQVLSNLLSNALKFAGADSHVMIRLRAHGDQARIEVADDGPGIPPELHRKVFERFYQVDNTSTRKVGGAGLGLAIAKAIIEEGHQGKIWVEATPGGGSTFVFTLPAQNAPAELPVPHGSGLIL